MCNTLIEKPIERALCSHYQFSYLSSLMTPTTKSPLLAAMFSMKCPECRNGYVFVNRHVFPLGQAVRMREECTVCNYKLLSERNNGGGINYALTVIVFFLNLIWCWPLFHINYLDNSIYYYLAASTAVVLLLQPFLMRLSRMIYLYLYHAVSK
jgi:uncharacterized protein (DUF983 family)